MCYSCLVFKRFRLFCLICPTPCVVRHAEARRCVLKAHRVREVRIRAIGDPGSRNAGTPCVWGGLANIRQALTPNSQVRIGICGELTQQTCVRVVNSP